MTLPLPLDPTEPVTVTGTLTDAVSDTVTGTVTGTITGTITNTLDTLVNDIQRDALMDACDRAKGEVARYEREALRLEAAAQAQRDLQAEAQGRCDALTAGLAAL